MSQSGPSLCGTPKLGHAFLMPEELRSRRLIVLVHGSRGSPGVMLKQWRGLSRRLGVALLAPDYTTQSFSGFQQLRGADGRYAASAALLELVTKVTSAWNLEREHFDLLGYSGGAQFAHRFALSHPQRINSLIVIAAGWYTQLSWELEYPLGLCGLEGAQEDSLSSVKTLVVVGEDDVEQGRDFRRGALLDRLQGVSRLERARNWYGQAERVPGFTGQLLIVPGVAHNLRALIEAGAMAAVIDTLEDTPHPDARPCTTVLNAENSDPETETVLRAVR